ncbi:glycosyltransferase family 2 protein [Pseudonocardia acidicola]|uniref:Glycosyltransferase n=1 Tax=Pseudonocardia acidicola TaxID=2724939 RepID=A0ABX1S5Y5_9PSEU|nr:glycosyltransferase [Pseudonocardia acidicola]NMH96980.1 glycosyltransferase [Pseudonocardia acidicola]
MALTDVLVPGNRWDLLAPYPVPHPRVSIVVAHYEQPAQLARTWAALCAQTRPPAEVIITDDGSATPPRSPRGGPPVRVVRQDDRGFRAAAARNLGARHATGEVLVFLDADTVPEPGFVEQIVRRIAVCPDVLAVGRRRHADLSGLSPATVTAWLTGAGAAPPELPEPGWLRDGYRTSRDLLDADGRSFRFVISAVLACRRALFADLGGFDERFVGYGGEDWDLAYRAWNAGAVLVHERDAVAWHDGPDWAGRAADRTRKDAEATRLAALIPEPATRGVALPGAVPDVLVDLEAGWSLPDTARCVHALLGQTHRDLRIRLPGGPDTAALSELYAGVAGTAAWTPDQLRRARIHLRLHRPAALPPDAVAAAVQRIVCDDLGAVELRSAGATVGTAVSARARGRARRWAGRLPAATVCAHAFGTGVVELDPGPAPRDDLAGFFAAAAEPRPLRPRPAGAVRGRRRTR